MNKLQFDFRMAMELANQTLAEALEKEANDITKRISNLEEDVGDEIKKTRKELKEKIDNDCGETKRKVELETNEIRYVFSGMFLSNFNIN